MLRIALAVLLGGAAISLPCKDATASHAVLTVDARQRAQAFRPLQGTAGLPGPAPVAGLDHIPDATGLWRDAHVSVVRSFDWAAKLDTVDNPDGLFPHWSADPETPSSYNFAAADRWVRAVRAIGAEVQFTFASNIPANKRPPADLAKYQTVVEHIVRHYVTGWDNGMQHAVRRWEFSDQPDFGKLHYAGTSAQFVDQYAAIAEAVKRVDPTMLVGGPGLAFPLNPDAAYREGFLSALRQRHLPLDFFSFLWFGDVTRDPQDFVVVGKQLRHLLDASGFPRTKLVLASWNYAGIPTTKVDPLETAAFQAVSSIYMQDSSIDNAFLFRGDAGIDPFYHFTDPAHIFVTTPQKDPRASALVLVGKTLSCGRRLAISGGDAGGFAALAALQPSAGKMCVLIANFAVPPEFLKPRAHDYNEFVVPEGQFHELMHYVIPHQRQDAASAGHNGFDLAISQLPWGHKAARVTESWLLGDGRGLGTSMRVFQDGSSLHLSGDLAAPGVMLIEIQPAGATKQ